MTKDEALERKAENARELGLDYEPLEAKDEPHGWKLVPIEPTYEMLKAMDECSTEGYDERLYAGHAASVYMAAVNVAPSPSQQHAEDLAKLGWQYFECPACGSEGAKAFPKSEAKDEPVAWAKFSAKGNIFDLLSEPDDDYTPLYTAPPQRTWVGLTDEERSKIWGELPQTLNPERDACVFAETIEVYLKEKNT